MTLDDTFVFQSNTICQSNHHDVTRRHICVQSEELSESLLTMMILGDRGRSNQRNTPVTAYTLFDDSTRVVCEGMCIDPSYIVVSPYCCSKNFRADIIGNDGTIKTNQYLLRQHRLVIHIPIDTRERLNASFCQVLCPKPDFRVLLAQTPAEIIPPDQERRRQRSDQQIYVPPATSFEPKRHVSPQSTWGDRGPTRIVVVLVLYGYVE